MSKVATYRRYGAPSVLSINEREPLVPGVGEILVSNRAATVGASDAAARRGTPHFARLYFGLLAPKQPVLGSDFAGVVESVGAGVEKFAVGDKVFGLTGEDFGSHAEQIAVRASGPVELIPQGWSFAEAVSIADLTAFVFIWHEARLEAGQLILINGAAGAVGAMAVQFAKRAGTNVTAICSTENVDWVRGLGADRVVDRTHEDVREGVQRYDVVFDAVGLSSYRQFRRVIAPGGVYLSTVPSLPLVLRLPWWGSRRARVAFTGLRARSKQSEDLYAVAQLAAEGSLRPIIGTTFAFEQVAEAHKLVDTGRKRGAAVLAIKR